MHLPHALRTSLRSLLRSPFLYGCAILALALGIAAPTTMFTITDGVLRDLPVPEPDRLVHIGGTNPRFSSKLLLLDGRWFAALRDRQRTLEGVAAHAKVIYDVAGAGGLAERRSGAQVSPNMFGLLGVTPVRGRDFTPDDVIPGAAGVVIISHDFWHARLGGDEAILGERIRLNGVPHTVVGIMERGFEFPDRQQLWTPVRFAETDEAHPIVGVFGRRPADVTLAQINAELESVAAAIHEQYPDWTEGVGFRAAGYSHAMIDDDERMILRVMTVLFFFVLIIACANVTNLLLARAAARSQEVAVRAALGAGGVRLALEQLAESAWIAVPGAILGLMLSRVGVAALATQLAEFLPFWVKFDILGSVLVFTMGCMLAAIIVAGLMPALQALRMDPNRALRDGDRGVTFRVGRLARGLVTVEVALSVSLLIVAAAATRGVVALGTGSEYDAASVATARWTLRGERYAEPAAVRMHMQTLLGRVSERSEVQVAAAASHLPDIWSGWRRVALPGVVYDQPESRPLVHESVVTPGYFAALGSSTLRGRDFSPADGADAPMVAIVNRPFVDRHLPGIEPLGAQLVIDDATTSEPVAVTIIGVVPHLGVRTEERDVAESIYIPFAQHPRSSMALVVRTSADAGALARELPQIAAAVDGDVALYEAQSLDTLIAEMRRTERAFGILFIVIGLAALLLAAVGLAGVIAYSVRRRTRELGIRAALGATPARLVRAALGGSIVQLVIGGVAGTALGMAATHALGQSVLLGVGAADPAVLVTVPVVLAAVGVIAAWAPGRHASRLQVMDAIRN